MTTFNHTPYPTSMAAKATNFNAALEELDAAIGLNNLSATTDPTTSDDFASGYRQGISKWLNTNTDGMWFCVDHSNGAAVWINPASGSNINASNITQGTLGLAYGGTGADFSSTSAGFVKTTGAAWSVGNIELADIPINLKNRFVVGGTDAFNQGDLLDAISKHTVKISGTTIGSRRAINFIAGANTTITGLDNSGDEQVDITVVASGGTGSGTDELVAVGTSGTPDYLNEDDFERIAGQNIRLKLRGHETKSIYVSTVGNDTTGDGSQGNPYATIDKALSTVPLIVDSTITILLENGTYWDGGGVNFSNRIGRGHILLRPVNDAPGNVTIQAGGGPLLSPAITFSSVDCDITIRHFDFSSCEGAVKLENCNGSIVLDTITMDGQDSIASFGIWCDNSNVTLNGTFDWIDTNVFYSLNTGYMRVNNSSGANNNIVSRATAFGLIYEVGTVPAGTTAISTDFGGSVAT